MNPETSAWMAMAVDPESTEPRPPPPRTRGLTMVIDTGLGLSATEDVLEMSGEWIDHWKLSFGTSVFVPRDVLARKLAMINDSGILTFPGGTLFEAAIVRRECRPFMALARSLGFTAVEVSEGTIDLPPERRGRVIRCGLDAGLTVITEVGKKDPADQPTPESLGEQARRDLDDGAAWVVVEGRESGRGVGVYDDAGATRLDLVDEIALAAGDATDRLIWEAPHKDQQSALVARFGANVNLGNIDPSTVLALESLRSGLRFETLRPITQKLQASGRWRPAEIEDGPTEV